MRCHDPYEIAAFARKLIPSSITRPTPTSETSSSRISAGSGEKALHCENIPKTCCAEPALPGPARRGAAGRDVDYIVKDGKVLSSTSSPAGSSRPALASRLQALSRPRKGYRSKRRTDPRLDHPDPLRSTLSELCGMTATAQAAPRSSLRSTADRRGDPAHRPSVRVDDSDLVFFTREAKHRPSSKRSDGPRHGRPILVGTCSVAESDELAEACGARA